MQQDWLDKRVELLELAMEGLTAIPDAVRNLDRRVSALEQQVMQQRAETRSEFSATRAEMRALNEETRTQARLLHEEVLDRIKTLGESGPPSSPRCRRS